MKNLDTEFLIHESMDEYHAKAGEFLASHRLADFRRAPILFRRKELGLVEEADRPAFQVGRAAHTLILEGPEVFEKEYSVGGPVNPKTGNPYGSRTKKYQEWAEAQGKPVLPDDQHQLIKTLRESVHGQERASELLSGGVPEGVVRAEYCGVPCQIRMDWFNPERGFVDLKTADDLAYFESDARRYRYAHQMAFYRAVLAVAIGTVVPVWMIAVEKKEPFRCGVWLMGTDVLGVAQKENEEAIERLKKCRKTDAWPTGYEGVRDFDYI